MALVALTMLATIVLLDGAACFGVSFLCVGAIVGLGLWADMPRHLRIAADGLELRTLARRQFVPWDDVTSVAVTDFVLTISRARTRPIELYRTPTRWPIDSAPDQLLGSLGWDVENALARHRRSKESPRTMEAVLRRGDRTAEMWVAGLRELASGDTYRANVLARDELLDVVEQSADASARAGAALTLARLGLRSDERERVIVTRVRVAEPALAHALEAALEGDDRAAERAALRVRARRLR